MDALNFYTTNNNKLNNLDLGDAAPGSSDDYALRLFNTSESYQAEDVTVTATGDDAIQLWLSPDDEAYSASIQIGDIAPGSVSDVFWLRRVVPTTADTGAHAATLTAQPAAWTTPAQIASSGNVALDEDD